MLRISWNFRSLRRVISMGGGKRDPMNAYIQDLIIIASLRFESLLQGITDICNIPSHTLAFLSQGDASGQSFAQDVFRPHANASNYYRLVNLVREIDEH